VSGGVDDLQSIKLKLSNMSRLPGRLQLYWNAEYVEITYRFNRSDLSLTANITSRTDRILIFDDNQKVPITVSVADE